MRHGVVGGINPTSDENPSDMGHPVGWLIGGEGHAGAEGVADHREGQ